MPYFRPTLTAIRQSIAQDIAAQGLPATGLLRWSVLQVLSYCMAGLAYGHYAYQDYIALQSVPSTATDEFAAQWGALKDVYQKDAVSAEHIVAGTGTPGRSLPAGTVLTRADGYTYAVNETVLVANDSSVSATVTATTPGSASTAANGTPLTVKSAVDGINSSSFVVTSQITAGVDQETQDAFKTRYLASYRNPPQGGSVADYSEWSLAIPGVTRAWVAPALHGAGSVAVFFMMDVAEQSHAGFPQGTNGVAAAETRDPNHKALGDQLTIANGLYVKQPVTALVYAQAATPQPINFVITGLGSANTATNQAGITASLTDMFLRLGNVGGTLNPDNGQAWPEIDPSSWYTAIGSVVGNGQFGVSTPSAPIVSNNSQLPILGTVTFQS